MDSGKAEGREKIPAGAESSVESGREIPAGGQEDIAEVRRIGLQSSAAGPRLGRGAPWRSRPPKSRHMSEGHGGGVNKSLRLPGFIEGKGTMSEEGL